MNEGKNIQTSIIIPTYNRANIIKKTIERLSDQTYPFNKYEVIIVDDGSVDNTKDIVKSMKVPYILKYFRQEKKGASAARNYGIKKARGEIIIFIDSDISVNQNFIEEHINYHQQKDNIIVRGTVINTENIDNLNTKKMKLTDISYAFFATGNASIRKEYLLKVGLFDEDFKEYGWEDLELGVRLKKQGLKVITNKKAVGYHYRKKPTLTDLSTLCAKEKMRGRTAVLFYRKHPTFEVRYMTHISSFFFGLDRLLNWNNWMKKKWGKNLLLYLEKHNSHLLLNFFMKIIIRHSYINGVKEAFYK